MAQNETNPLETFNTEFLEMFKNTRRVFCENLNDQEDFISRAKVDFRMEGSRSIYDIHDEIFRQMYNGRYNFKSNVKKLISLLWDTDNSDLAFLLKSYSVYKPHFLLIITDKNQDEETEKLRQSFQSMNFTVGCTSVNEFEEFKFNGDIDLDGIFLLVILCQIDEEGSKQPNERNVSVGKIIEHFLAKTELCGKPKLFLINSKRVAPKSNNNDASNNEGKTPQGNRYDPRNLNQTDSSDRKGPSSGPSCGTIRRATSTGGDKTYGETVSCEKDDAFVVHIFFEDKNQSFGQFLVKVFEDYKTNGKNNMYSFENLLCDINSNLHQGMVAACWIPKKHLIFSDF